MGMHLGVREEARIMGWWIADLYQSGHVVELVSWIVWVLFSIVMHELAHGWAAIWQGDDTPRRLNRMTMNPWVHMGPWSLLMFALVGIAWGLMPTDPSRYRWRRKGRIVVAAAGPAMNLVLAFVTLTAAALWVAYSPAGDPLHANAYTFLMTGGWLNLLLAAFNLLPVPPLDGSQILMGMSFRFYQLFQKPEAMMVGMFLVLAIFFSGIGARLFGVVNDWAEGYVKLLLGVLP